jgi:hypothetical protein
VPAVVFSVWLISRLGRDLESVKYRLWPQTADETIDEVRLNRPDMSKKSSEPRSL